jgi:hypothetical protein
MLLLLFLLLLKLLMLSHVLQSLYETPLLCSLVGRESALELLTLRW